MGSFYPFVSRSMTGERALGPYAITFVFAIGVAVCALPVNYLLMQRPLIGGTVSRNGYWTARASWQGSGILGGGIWYTGAVFNFVASRATPLGPALSYSIGQGATMVSAAWVSSSGKSSPGRHNNPGLCSSGCSSAFFAVLPP